MSAEKQKLLGRKTGWCNSPSTADPNYSHSRCDGIWNEKDGDTYHCPCECHDIIAKKLANAKKYKRKSKPEPKKPQVVEACSSHPTYGGVRKPRKKCDTCWDLYYTKNPNKRTTTS